MTPRIDSLTAPPVVGSFYLVPCVEVTRNIVPRKVGVWPITGPNHEDAEHIEFPARHWHYDLRFLTEDQFNGLGYHPHSHVLISSNPDGTARDDVAFGPVVYKRLRCRRDAPEYPHAKAERYWLPKLRAAYCEKTITCGKCPHRGLPIASLPREPGTDIVTCPGHGLRWDLSTGKLMPARLNDRGD